MSTSPRPVAGSVRGFRETAALPLHERISGDLKAKFRDRFVECNARNFAPDFVIRNDQRVAVIEIKTGDPSLPLPSSANTQMLILKDDALTKLGFQDVVPVLVTNYQIDDADRKELETGGIKIITIQGSTYDSKALSDELEAIVAAHAKQ